MPRMTKAQAEADFRETYLPGIIEQERQTTGYIDEPLRSEAWNNYTDALCKDGLISDHQYANWVHPRWLYTATNRY